MQEADLGEKVGQQDWLKFARDNWHWVIPIFYAYISVVGMIDAGFRFHAFGINIFEFAEINDFLLAALREPKAFLTVILISVGGIFYSLLVTYIIPRIQRRLAGSRLGRVITVFLGMMMPFPFLGRFGKWMGNTIAVVYVCGAPFLIPYTATHVGKENLVADPNRQVAVTFRVTGEPGVSQKVQQLALIGTTERYIFFYDRESKKYVVAPTVNVILFRQQ